MPKYEEKGIFLNTFKYSTTYLKKFQIFYFNERNRSMKDTKLCFKTEPEQKYTAF